MTKVLNLLLTAAITLWSTSNFAAPVIPSNCSLDSNGAITNNFSTTTAYNTNAVSCLGDNNDTSFTLFKFGLCTSEPDTSNPTIDWAQKCDFIFDKTTGTQVTARYGEEFNVPGVNLSVLRETTYTHVVVMAGKDLKHKERRSFSTNKMGKGGSVGTICYTVSGTTYSKSTNTPSSSSDFAVKCVANEAAMSDFGYMTVNNDWVGPTSPTKLKPDGDRVFLIKSDAVSLATVDMSTKSSDAAFNLVVMQLPTPQRLTAYTRKVNLGWQVRGAGQVQFYAGTFCNSSNITAPADSCVTAIRGYDMKLRATFE